MEIRAGRSDDSAAAAAFIADVQGDPSSMIPYLSPARDQLAEELNKMAPPWTDAARLAFHDGRLVGVAFVELDLQQCRVWIYGPWVVEEHWDRVADALVQTLLDQVVPAGIHDVELSGHVEHVRLAALAEQRDLARSNVFFVLGLNRAQTVGWEAPKLDRLADAQAGEVARLHDELFPGAPWTGRQLLEKARSGVTILVTADGEIPVGYVAFDVQPGPEGFIHFVGVRADYRLRGIGRTLAMAAVSEILADPAVPQVFLSVDNENTGAVALYRSLGFFTELAMVGFRTPAAMRRRPTTSSMPF